MGGEDLTDEAASHRGCQQLAWDVGFFHRFLASSGDPGVVLPVGEFSVPVTLEELPPEPFRDEALAGFQSVLQQRAMKYSAARSRKFRLCPLGARPAGVVGHRRANSTHSAALLLRRDRRRGVSMATARRVR